MWARSRAQAEADFKREAELLGSLSNEHVPHVYDAFSEKNAHYLVMEYVEGETLEEKFRMSSGRLTDETAVEIGIQISDTVGYLHCRNPPVISRP